MPGAPTPPVRSKDASHAAPKDVIVIRNTGDDKRWFVIVTLGTVPHDLGEFPSVSAALTALMHFYYQHRPPVRRRKSTRG